MATAYNPYDRTKGPAGCKGKLPEGDPCKSKALPGGFCRSCSPIFRRRRIGLRKQIWTK